MLETPVRTTPSLPKVPSGLPDPFVFVPITQSEAAKGRGAAKRIVRAHVTRVQHAKSSTLHQNLENWTVKPYVPRDSSVPIRRKARAAVAAAAAINGNAESKTNGVTTNSNGKVIDRPRGKKLQRDNSSSSSDNSTGGSGSGSQDLMVISSPKLLFGNSGEDPFWTYPVKYEPELPAIFAHYIQNVAVEIPDLDGPFDRGALRRRWFPLAMTSAATMYAILLMAASHYAIMNPTRAKLIDLLSLKARALSEINNSLALSGPGVAPPDALIGAVAKMAAYEAIFGDSKVFAAHMQGLRMMLKLRGGLGTLGLNGLLERMLVWIDLNSAHLLGTAKTLGDEECPTSVIFAAPDPFHFAGIQ